MFASPIHRTATKSADRPVPHRRRASIEEPTSQVGGHSWSIAKIPIFSPEGGPKLKIGAIDDPLEREADRAADRVMGKSDAGAGISAAPPQVSLKCATCDEEDKEKKEKIQTKRTDAGLAGGEAPPIVHEVLKQPGQPLDTSTRAFMEERFGRDFSAVRILDDPGAGQASLALRARAFTVRSHVVFAPGEYSPQTEAGRHLLAHELAHTVQQNTPGSSALPIQRTTYPNCTDKQVADMVKPAKEQAIADLDSVMTSLGERPLADDTKAALFLAFQSEDEATADMVKASFQKIRDGLDTDSIECDQPADKGALGETLTPSGFQCIGGRLGYTTPLFNIHVCMKNWLGASEVLRLQNLIHEGAHAFEHLIGDSGYFDYYTCAETASTAKLGPGGRLGTPDAYSCFVHYLKHDSGIKVRAESYKGKTVAVTQDPGGPIDLNGTDEKTPMFRLSGVPDNSGLQFRWVIADTLDRRYLMRADSGDPFDYGDHTATFIGKPTRALLKQRGVLSAKVLCRVTNPIQTDRLMEFPVRFTGV